MLKKSRGIRRASDLRRNIGSDAPKAAWTPIRKSSTSNLRVNPNPVPSTLHRSQSVAYQPPTIAGSSDEEPNVPPKQRSTPPKRSAPRKTSLAEFNLERSPGSGPFPKIQTTVSPESSNDSLRRAILQSNHARAQSGLSPQESDAGPSSKAKRKVHWADQSESSDSEDIEAIPVSKRPTDSKGGEKIEESNSQDAFARSFLSTSRGQYRRASSKSSSEFPSPNALLESTRAIASSTVSQRRNSLSPSPCAKHPSFSGSHSALRTTTSSPANITSVGTIEEEQTTQSLLYTPADTTQSTAIEEELNYIRSDLFDPQLLRPGSDLSQIFDTLASAFGEPGTGLLQARFTPPSPQMPIFKSDESESWDEKSKISPYSFLYESKKKAAERNATRKPQKYHVDSSLKSRRIEIQMLRIRIPHSMLLSFNLNLEARKDAVEIGLRTAPVGYLDAVSLGRQIFRAKGSDPPNTNDVGASMKNRDFTSAGVLNKRTGNRRRNSDQRAWVIGTDGRKRRRRESDSEEARQRQSEIRRRMNIKRAADEGNHSLLEQLIGNGGERKGSSATGMTDLMVWKLIRLSAVVEVDGDRVHGRVGVGKREEVQHSWWAVPERAVTGIF